MKRRTGKVRGAFLRDARGSGRLEAGSRASFTGSRPLPPWTSAQEFLYFCTTCDFEKLGKTELNVVFSLCG